MPVDASGDTGTALRCSPADDPDGDRISTGDEDRLESPADKDGDGRPASRDDDSDGDGILDSAEAGRADCTVAPVDTDQDGTPDFLDTDANGDGTLDREQGTGDLDGDSIPDVRDPDIDGDGILNTIEFGEGTTPVDTDRDGTPDVRDLDSDADTISDRDEGSRDVDRDGKGNYVDLDSDDDGSGDMTEAGDADLATSPIECMREINPVTQAEMRDGRPDFADTDSDNDGLLDRRERELGSSVCNVDSDADGVGDLPESAYQELNCRSGVGAGCDCITRSDCTIPDSFFYIVLPHNAPAVERDLDFSTTIRSADIFFLTDVTASMGSTIRRVQNLVATPDTGVIDRIAALIPDVWLGGGEEADLPLKNWGEFTLGRTPPFAPEPDLPLRVASIMRDRSEAATVRTAFSDMRLRAGGDYPESHTEAIYQILRNEGGTHTFIPSDGPEPMVIITPFDAGLPAMDGGFGDAMAPVPPPPFDAGFIPVAGGRVRWSWPRPTESCPEGRWGAPCFRPRAMPVVVHFTDASTHNGPPSEDDERPVPEWTQMKYEGLDPVPAEYVATMTLAQRRGLKYVGINAYGRSCEDIISRGLAWMNPLLPCFWFEQTARLTRTRDLMDRPLVYDLANGASLTDAMFVDTLVGALEKLVTEVPFDVDSVSRDDLTDEEGIDATRFIEAVIPACNATPPVMPCWTPPARITRPEDAVRATTATTFERVVPGTAVKFRVRFRNTFYRSSATQLFIAFIDIRADQATVLDTRQVIIVVPADSGESQ